MRVTVHYFARLRELAGRDTGSYEVPDGSTVADVWQRAVAQHPAIAALDGSLACAVNAEFASMNTPVHDGDDVAFLPPVSGGTWTEP